MAGRNRKLPTTTTGHRSKEEKEKQLLESKKLGEFTPLNFEKIPDILNREQRKIWRSLAIDLANLPLSELDRNLLASYCVWVNVFNECTADINEHGSVIIETRRDDTIRKKNPSVEVLATASKEIKSIAGNLGLTIDSRLRLIAGDTTAEEVDEDDDFAGI